MLRIFLSGPIWLSTNLLFVCAFAFGNGFNASVERSLVRVSRPTRHLHEREEVLGRGHLPIPGRRRDGDGAERRSAGRRIEDALDDEGLCVPVRERDHEWRARLEVVVLRVAVVDERAVAAEL